MIGTSIAHYKITQKLGRGGMGEVYLAEDTNLERQVALKVLPSELVSDRKLLQRLQREAKALAALDHPNIVTVFSFEEAGDVYFLTMAYMAGQTLDKLIPPGGLPVERFLELALPMTEALVAAHKQGIIHRDLKPANVMVDKEDRLRVLDFGLSKRMVDPGGTGFTNLSTDMTREGMAHGTVPYMSPEQAEGKELDARSDLFSLGIIFYEMLTASRPFQGSTPAALMSSILKDTPSRVEEVRSEIPSEVGRLISRCLEKGPDNRIQTALDVRNELKALQTQVVSTKPVSPLSKWGLAVGVVAVAAMLIVAWVLFPAGDSAAGPGPVTIRPLTSFIGWEWSPTWSPDASMIAFAHTGRGNADVATLSVGGGDPHLLTGHSNADEISPRWSPDGTKIAYISDRGAGTDVYWIAPTGGAEHKVTETNIPFLERMGAWAGAMGSNPWSPDSRELLFSRLHNTGEIALWKVNLETGEETQVTFPPVGSDDIGAAWSFDGNWIAFSRRERGTETVWLLSAEGGEPTLLLEGDSISSMLSWYPDNRRIVLSSLRGGAPNLWQLDTETKALNQLTSGGGIDWAPTVARNGSVAFVQFRHQIDLYWAPLNRQDEEEERLTTYTGNNFGARVSPDGGRIVYYSDRSGNFDLWIIDLATGQHRQLTTHTSNDRLPDWSPDGEEIVFMSDRGGRVRLWVVQTETGVTRSLSDHELPWSGHTAEGQAGPRWSPDGSVIGHLAPEEGNAIWLINPDGSNRHASQVRNVLSFGWYLDGRRVIYTRRAPDGSGSIELRAADFDTGQDELLRMGSIAEVAVSADGSALSFIEAESHFTMDLHMLHLRPPTATNRLPSILGEPEQITCGNGQWHVHSGGWAPDGSAFVYSRDQDEGNIYIIEPQ